MTWYPRVHAIRNHYNFRRNYGLLYNKDAVNNILIPSGWQAFNGSEWMFSDSGGLLTDYMVTNTDPDRLNILQFIKETQLKGGVRQGGDSGETALFIHTEENSYYWTRVEWVGWDSLDWPSPKLWDIYTPGYYLTYQVESLYPYVGDPTEYRHSYMRGGSYYWSEYEGVPIEDGKWGMHVRCVKPDPTHTIWYPGYTMTDYDGNIYDTVLIGDTIVTAQNLEVKHFRDGTPIPHVTSYSDWMTTGGSAYCYYNNDTFYS